jgi:predicted acylesterase/phospholipase RssA
VLTRSIDIMQGSIARLKLAAYAPDKVIDIPRQACTFFEFHRAEELASPKTTLAWLTGAIYGRGLPEA